MWQARLLEMGTGAATQAGVPQQMLVKGSTCHSRAYMRVDTEAANPTLAP